MPRDIFISHAFEDQEYVRSLCAGLEQNGLTCWLAPRDISAGQKWPKAIADGISNSTYFLLVLSRHSNASKQVDREVALADDQNKQILCLDIDDIEPSGSLAFYLANLHRIKAIGEPVSKTVNQLKSQLGTTFEHTARTLPRLIPRSQLLSPGDDLAGAIRQAAEGETLHLSGGDYHLSRRLLIEKDLTLAGVEGRPRILCSGPESVLSLAGASWTLTGLDFIHEGDAPADVVRVDGKSITLRDCTFSGAIRGGDEKSPIGSGFVVGGDTGGLVSHCTFHNNQCHGLLVLQNANPTLEDNRCEGNHQSGIAYCHYSTGQAVRNDCNRNHSFGISVSEHATPCLRDNTCEANLNTGLAYYDSASGQATGNVCRLNRENGLVVGGAARPLLENNILEKNEGNGIFIFGTSRVEVLGNQCLDNRNHGISISGTACPKLDGNTCRANGGYGIHNVSRSRPRLGNNTNSGNKLGPANL